MPLRRRNIDFTLLQYLQSEGSEKEHKEEVENWIAHSEKNRSYFEQFEKLWKKKNLIEPLKAIDAEKIRAGLQQKIYESQAASGNIPLRRRNLVISWRAAAAVLVILAASTTLLLIKSGPGNPVQMVSSASKITSIVLSDGSLVELNRDSQISYPERMKRRRREVTLTGEAYFNITSIKNVPFFVHLGSTTVQVRSTSFNLKQDEGLIILSVISGNVLFYESGQEDDPISVQPGQKAVYHSVSGSIALDSLKSENFLFWKTSTLTYKDEPLEVVFQDLEEYFNTNIVVSDKAILKYRWTTSFVGQQLQEILHELTLLPYDLYYSEKNDTVYVHKGPR